jgi:hypothetical protein
MEHIAEEGNVGGVIFDEQNVNAHSGSRHGVEGSMLGLILAPGLAILANFFGLFEELPRATEGRCASALPYPAPFRALPGLSAVFPLSLRSPG